MINNNKKTVLRFLELKLFTQIINATGATVATSHIIGRENDGTNETTLLNRKNNGVAGYKGPVIEFRKGASVLTQPVSFIPIHDRDENQEENCHVNRPYILLVF